MTTRFADHLPDRGTHAARPAATTVPVGTLYSCSDHSLIYKSDGATWSTWATLGSGGSPGRVLLDTQTLAAAAASITFGSGVVPTSGYKHLEIELLGRSSQAAATTGVTVELNADTTSGNYSGQRMLSEGSSMFAGSVAGGQCGYIAGDSATAGVAGTLKLTIPDFLGTTWRKAIRTESYAPTDLCLWHLTWANTVAVTQVLLKPISGNFKIGTVARLYGLA